MRCELLDAMAHAASWALAIARRCSSRAPKAPWASVCSEVIFPVLQRLRPCLPLYRQTLKAVKAADFKVIATTTNTNTNLQP